MTLLVQVALRHLRFRARQTATSVVGVAVGVGFSIAMAAFMEGSQRDYVNRVINTMPHIMITDEVRRPPPQPGETAFTVARIDGIFPVERLRGIPSAPATLEFLESWVPGRVAPAFSGSATLRFGGKDVNGQVIGIDPEADTGVSKLSEQITAGSYDQLGASGDSTIVGEGLLRRLGARVGSTITASTAAGGSARLKIVGTFSSGSGFGDRSQAYVLLKTAQRIQNRPNAVNQIKIKLADPAAAKDLADDLERRLGHQAMSWQEQNQPILETFRVRNVIMYTAVSAILVVAAFGIFNVVSTIINEKTRDIAILKSMGFKAGWIEGLFIAEGIALAVLGAALGCAIGYGLSLAIGSVQVTGFGTRLPTALPVFYSWTHYAIACAFAVGAAVFAAWLPSRKAARVHPVEIVRGAA